MRCVPSDASNNATCASQVAMVRRRRLRMQAWSEPPSTEDEMSLRPITTLVVILATLIAFAASAQHVVPSALLTIDQHRATVVERIVGEWGDRLASSNAGISAPHLRQILSSLRSDHLLAASLAGSIEGLRDVVSAALVHTDAKISPTLMHT